MSEKSKILSEIKRAEMIGDERRVQMLKRDLDKLDGQKPGRSSGDGMFGSTSRRDRPDWRKPTNHDGPSSRQPDYNRYGSKAQKFLKGSSSLSSMFVQESKLTSSDETKMFLKTSSKFSREDAETKYYSTEVDNSQSVLNRSKKQKTDYPDVDATRPSDSQDLDVPCSQCLVSMPRRMIMHNTVNVYLAMPGVKPYLPDICSIYLSNTKHGQNSFVASEAKIQMDCEEYMKSLSRMWRVDGDHCIMMETYLRDRRPNKGETTSCGRHFKVHCIPIKSKYLERARMSFKQSIQECEGEWSLNKKLLSADGRRIQRCLPKGLSYFWVCFDDLTNGFAHVIENEREFSRFFGLEVLASVLGKNFNPINIDTRDSYEEAAKRFRDFKAKFVTYHEESDEKPLIGPIRPVE